MKRHIFPGVVCNTEMGKCSALDYRRCVMTLCGSPILIS